MAQATNRRAILKRILAHRRLWAVLILLIGLGLMLFFGTRTLRAYRELTYAREQGLLNGSASVDAIQPWMTIRYIAVAYAVPEEYIYAQLEIPFDLRSAREPLGRLSHQRGPNKSLNEPLNTPSGSDQPAPDQPPPDLRAERAALLAQVRSIILAYRENPVAPGLRDIRPWMSLAYIANSTGVPVEYLFTELEATANTIIATESAERAGADGPKIEGEIATEENQYKPLELLSAELHYPGGPRRILDAVRDALANYNAESTPEQP